MAEKAGEIYYDIEADVSGLLKAQGKANKSLDSIGNSATTAAKKMDELQTNINRVAGAIAASLVVDWGKAFLVAADNMSQLNARIERLTGSAATASQTMQSLMRISSATGGSLQDTAKLWETLSTALRDTGATNGQIIQLTETLQKIGRIGGSSSEEMANALRQFGQSISSGTVRAEEFNSILEQMPELARQIAAGMGVSIGELRQLMLDGKLTAEDALNAIQKQTGSVNAEFEKLPRTLSQANTALTNSFLSMIDSVNQATGASSGLVAIIDSMTAALDRLVGKAVSADAQISDLNSTAEMFNRRARTWSWLGLDGWEAQNKALAGLSNKAAMLVGDLDAVTKASKTAANTKPIEIKTTGTTAGSKAKGGASAAQKEAEQYAKAQETVNQKLDELRQKAELSAGSVGELSRAQSILNAQQSLGKSATEEQIRLAGEYAGKIWDTANALKNQAKAEQANKAAQQLIAQTKSTSYNGGLAEDPFAAINLEEQQKLTLYNQYHEQGLISQQTYEDAMNAIMTDAAQRRLDIQQKQNETMMSGWSDLSGAASQLAGSLAGAFQSASGEASGAYAAMFAISKAFSIAQASIGMYTAASQALMLPFPANLGAAAKALSFGSQIVGAVSGVNFSGARYNGGPVNAGGLYQVGEKGKPEIYQASTGKQYMIPGDNGRVISNKDMTAGGGVSVIINVQNMTGATFDAQATSNGDGTITVDAIIADLNNGGPISQGITSNFNAKRTPRGQN
ncbi:tape measure protein [Citrobacter freundii]|uniref:tape measure protein n=1 Tax=Citrobacter freundii TaxID=546 RepID=UPI002874CE2F|nr:tape measure protein [Citrobacter freundii]MDS0990974.1 tape measure protein [Citrobacter freundii]